MYPYKNLAITYLNRFKYNDVISVIFQNPKYDAVLDQNIINISV